MTWRKRWKVEEGRNPVKKEKCQRGLSGLRAKEGISIKRDKRC